MPRTRAHRRTVRTLDAQAKALLERDRLCAEHPHFGRFAALLSDRTGGVAAAAFDDGLGRT